MIYHQFEKAKFEFDQMFKRIEQEINSYQMRKWEDHLQINLKLVSSFIWYAICFYSKVDPKRSLYL